MEEMRFIFNEKEIAAQTRIREVFNPDNLLNGGKLFPSPGRCVEVKKYEGSCFGEASLIKEMLE